MNFKFEIRNSILALAMLLTAVYLLLNSVFYHKPELSTVKVIKKQNAASVSFSADSLNRKNNSPDLKLINSSSDNNSITGNNEITSHITIENAPPEKLPDIIKQEPINPDESKVFTAVEQNPSFPGGEQARIKFLQQNVKYPSEAIKKKIEGKVIINFIVERDGSVSNINVLKGICKECDEEALRVARLMPNWIPGRQSGRAVRVSFNMPINFRLKI